MLTLAEENYLKAIISISLHTDKNVSTNEISKETNTSAASVSDMMRKLEEKKLITHKKYKGVTLTKKGRKKAINILRKHRLWETFLFNYLDFDWGEVHEIAEQLEHIQSQKLTNKLDEFLNFPKFDPHGEPIPSINGKIEKINTQPLSKLQEGKNGIVMGVNIDNKPFLDYLTALKIQIGSQITVIKHIPFDKSINIKINKQTQHLSNEAAKHILIKKE